MHIIIDLSSSYIFDTPVLEILLEDKTTNRNIIWATNDYSNYGDSFKAESEIKPHLFATHSVGVAIRPRIMRTCDQQNGRTKEMAEVYTSSWLCNEQNNLIDEQWFGRKNVFNKQLNKAWRSQKAKIIFPNSVNRTWKDYVDARRIEISCGEAPYLVSRYDTVTGKIIDLHRRIGLLDRKIRVVNENTSKKNEWQGWVQRAYQSVYGYEYQGDNLLIARANLLYTFIDNFKSKFKQEPTINELCKIAKVISWNLWQMDGTTNAVPSYDVLPWTSQISLFEFESEAKYCQIKDWRSNKIIRYASLVKGLL